MIIHRNTLLKIFLWQNSWKSQNTELGGITDKVEQNNQGANQQNSGRRELTPEKIKD